MFIQGDRDLGGGSFAEAAMKIAILLNQKRWEANVGIQGDLVRIFDESGILCHGHIAAPLRTVHVGSIRTITDCNIIAQSLPREYRQGGVADPFVTWSLRLGIWASRSDAFLFFSGREGTIAHLVPILAWNRKSLAKEGRAKKVVLFGWSRDQMYALRTLGLWSPADKWLAFHENEEMAVEFLTKEG